MSGSISIWPQLPGFSLGAFGSTQEAQPAPPQASAAPVMNEGARSKMVEALYADVYAKSLPREEFDKKTAGMSDVQIADAAYSTFYDGKIDRADFNAKVGLKSTTGAADAMMRGGMMGFADEATAAAMTGVRGLGTLAAWPFTGKAPTMAGAMDAYNQELQSERDKRTVFNQNNPYLGTGLEVAGGVITGGAGAGVTAAAAPTRMQTVQNAARLGAVAGFGEGEGGLESRLVGAGVGAGLGAGMGAAIPIVTQGVSMALGRIGKVLGIGSNEKVSTQLLLKAFQDDGIPPDQIAARLAEWQKSGAKPETLFDIGGENVRRLARTAAGRTGPGTDRAVMFLEGRQGDQMRRVLGDVEGKLGQAADDFYPTLQALDTTRRTAAAPRYESSFARIVPTEEEAARVQHFITSKNGQVGLQRGLRILEEEQVKTGIPFNPKAYGVVRNDAGQWEIEPGKVPNLRLMDAVKRGYDAIINDYRDTVTGRVVLDDYGRAVEGNRAAYVRELRDMFPRYGGALDAWAGPSTTMDAAARGRNIFNMKDAEIASMAVSVKAKPGEADAFRLGVAQAIRDQIARAPDGSDAVKRIFGSPQKRDLLRAAFPDERSFLAFEALMKREAEMFKNAQFVSPRTGSQTQMRTDDAGGLGSMAADAAGALALGAVIPGRSMGGAMGQVATNLAARGRGVSSGVADALAARLFNSDPQAIVQTAGLLGQTEINNAMAKIQARRLGGLLLPGLAGGVNVAR